MTCFAAGCVVGAVVAVLALLGWAACAVSAQAERNVSDWERDL